MFVNEVNSNDDNRMAEDERWNLLPQSIFTNFKNDQVRPCPTIFVRMRIKLKFSNIHFTYYELLFDPFLGVI